MSQVQNLITQHLDTWTQAIETRSSVGRGSRNKLNLVGIKKLRELILEMAVRGLLVPQNSNDEPASLLLEKIAVEKAQLIKDGKIKKTKALPEISEDEKPFNLPNGWNWVRLGDIGNVFNGNSVNARLKTEKYTGVEGLPYIATKDVGYGFEPFDYENGVNIPFDEPKFQIAHKGAVLVCAEGGSAGKKCGITEQDICFGNKLFANELYGQIESKFILSLYLSPSFFERFSEVMTGIIGGISRANFLTLVVQLPPTEEQKRIVDKVDKLMALCDQLESQTLGSIETHQTLVETLLNELVNPNNSANFQIYQAWSLIAENFDILFTTEKSIGTLKQTILQLAVMGKLVSQNPNDEPASKLLEKIANEKAQLIKDGKIKKSKPLPEITDDEKPFDLPDGWEWTRFPDIGELARGKSKHRPRNDPKLYNDGNIPLIQTGDVSSAKNTDGKITTFTAKYNQEGLKQSRLWSKGTLCITIAANIADSGIMSFDACFPDSVVGFTPFIEEVDVKYFDLFIRTAKADLETFAPSTAQKNINLQILSDLIVPLPPLKELNLIVFKVNELMTLCDQLKTQLQTAQQTQTHLAQSIAQETLK